MDHEEASSPFEPRTKPKKPARKEFPPTEKAAHRLATPTLADRTWTTEQRLKGEKRDAFIRRILFSDPGEISGIARADETLGIDQTALKQEFRRHQRLPEPQPFSSLRLSEFAESSGSLPETAN